MLVHTCDECNASFDHDIVQYDGDRELCPKCQTKNRLTCNWCGHDPAEVERLKATIASHTAWDCDNCAIGATIVKRVAALEGALRLAYERMEHVSLDCTFDAPQSDCFKCSIRALLSAPAKESK